MLTVIGHTKNTRAFKPKIIMMTNMLEDNLYKSVVYVYYFCNLTIQFWHLKYSNKIYYQADTCIYLYILTAMCVLTECRTIDTT